MAEEKDIDSAIINQARYLFRYLTPPPVITDVDDIQVEHFVRMFELLTDETIPGSQEMASPRSKIIICQFMIDTLGRDILGMPLDHITGYDVVNGSRRRIFDLLEIFVELVNCVNRSGLKDITREIQDQETEVSPGTTNEDAIKHDNLRDVLNTLGEERKHLMKINEAIGQFSSLDVIKKLQDGFSQTTPRSFTTSGTSPITWGTVLSRVCKETEVQEHHKLPRNISNQKEKWRSSGVSLPTRKCQMLPKPKSSFPKRCSNSTGPATKPFVLRPSHTKAIKPKPVLGTKVRKHSDSSKTSKMPEKTKLKPNISNEQLHKVMEDALEIKDRLLNIKRQISQLQREETILTKIYNIMMKDVQQTLTTQPGYTKIGNKGRRSVRVAQR